MVFPFFLLQKSLSTVLRELHNCNCLCSITANVILSTPSPVNLSIVSYQMRADCIKNGITFCGSQLEIATGVGLEHELYHTSFPFSLSRSHVFQGNSTFVPLKSTSTYYKAYKYKADLAG